MRKIASLVLDFDGVLTDNRVIVGEDGKESVVCSRADSLGIEMIKKRGGVYIAVLSKETNEVVPARCQKLQVNCFYGVDDKVETLKTLGMPLENIAYMGNDVNDLECMRLAGISGCPADARDECKQIATFISRYNGGQGAVREFCDWLIEKEMA